MDCSAEKVRRSECEIYLFNCKVCFLKSFKQNFRMILGQDIQEKSDNYSRSRLYVNKHGNHTQKRARPECHSDPREATYISARFL